MLRGVEGATLNLLLILIFKQHAAIEFDWCLLISNRQRRRESAFSMIGFSDWIFLFFYIFSLARRLNGP